MMDPNGQPQMHPAYAYYSSGDEGPVDYVEAAYPHPQMQVPQHQYAIQSANIDMSQMRPQMQQMQMQHPQYAMQPHHPSMQPQVQQVAYDPSRNGIYQHPAVTSPPPPPSPYDAISPAPSVSDHSASGTESTGAPPIRTTGVPIMPAQPRIYHHHSHSSASSTSSLHGEHPYANPAIPYGAPDAALRRHSKTHSLDRHSVERTPPPGAGGQFQASDDDGDFGTMGPMDGYVNQISLLNRKESTRRQRIQAEQRRRDELRDGYARLKDVLPITSSKSSKVSLIERARNHIIDIDSQNANLKSEIDELKKEVARLQQISEKMAMSSVIPFGSVPNNAPNADGGEGNEHPNEGDPATTSTAVDPGITVLTGPDENDPFEFAKATPTKAEEDETMGTSPARERTPVNA